MIANHKGEIPFVILLIPFLLGITLGLNFAQFASTTILLILLLTLSTAFITLNIGYKKFNIYKLRWLGGILINLILFIFGWISIANYSELNRPNHFSKSPAQFVIIRINNEPILKNGLIRFTAKVEQSINKGNKATTSGTLLVTLKDSLAQTLAYGDEVLIPANYTLVDPPFNPAEFNYKQYLTHQNIYYQSFLYGHKYVILAHDAGNPIVVYALKLRQQLVKKLKANLHNPDAIAVASTMLLGYRADLSNDVLQAYSSTGTVYVLTVSGSQVAIIYFLLTYALSFLSRHKYGRLLRATIIIGVLWYYALLTGFSPAICRAVLVVSMVVIGKIYNRYINTLNILAFSAFVLLLYNPYLITEVGFQLAFLAVGGLIVLRPVVYDWFKFKNKFVDKLWAICSVSIAAQIITFPLSAFYFHQFPVYFLVSNVLLIIPAAIIMYTGILYLLLPQIAYVSHYLGWILEKTILLMNKGLSNIEQFPLSTINKIWLNTAEYLLLYAMIISLFYFLFDRKIWLLRLSLCCLLLLSISFSYKRITSANTHSIAFLNMRSHMGIVMRNGNQAIVLSDLSDTNKNYRYSIQPYLDSCKLTDITVYNPKQNVNSNYALKRSNLIQFFDKRILLFDKSISNCALNSKLTANYIYITGNPYSNFNNINKNYMYQQLIISAANSDRFVDQIQQIKWPVENFILLKRNKALIAVSN
ncbi:ComEC/Rec2 family competence protein [Mucilaginibacter sp. L196]|uniref:ComEC/Rec2 family competence protein n=1 Tax=Mucilaginibacter sp. L196 TaxID=1641870 RepID=UPI00131B14BF|nr:ComEC/Rec2 family competence protein [Mucilaginibacter sp. L196]